MNKGIDETVTKREIKTSYKDGNWKSYDETQGKLVSEGNYSDGKQNGKWKYFYPGGVIVNREVTYKTQTQWNFKRIYQKRSIKI